jgi:8-oxo-dGTP pyrophosphatase MutT (NUDIX family)
MTAAGPAPRHAATVLLVRDGAHPERPLEVLMVQRHPSMAFGGMWAFPGGAVEEHDALDPDGAGRFWACAARETVEETGLAIRVEDLHHLSHWITPEGAPARFDTRFFVAQAPDGEHAHHEREHTDSCWIRPADALDRHAAGTFDLILPTLRNLEAIGRCATVAELLDAVSVADDPRAIDDGGGWRIRLPGDPELVP